MICLGHHTTRLFHNRSPSVHVCSLHFCSLVTTFYGLDSLIYLDGVNATDATSEAHVDELNPLFRDFPRKSPFTEGGNRTLLNHSRIPFLDARRIISYQKTAR